MLERIKEKSEGELIAIAHAVQAELDDPSLAEALASFEGDLGGVPGAGLSDTNRHNCQNRWSVGGRPAGRYCPAAGNPSLERAGGRRWTGEPIGLIGVPAGEHAGCIVAEIYSPAR